MLESKTGRALSAARSIAAGLGFEVEDAVVLQNSNKLTVRLLPCDVLARVAPASDPILEFEIDVARRLASAGSPVARPHPRVAPEVYEEDGFRATFWTHYQAGAEHLGPPEYAQALVDLHAGMRQVDVVAPHFTDRLAQALRLLADRDLTPELPEVDRVFLAGVLRRPLAPGGREQLVHGEPHQGNLLATTVGPRFIDFETCCRGPVEFDLAHAPDDVADHYPGLDPDLLRDCRGLVLAIIVTWRWDRDDQFPDGRESGREWLAQLRAMPQA